MPYFELIDEEKNSKKFWEIEEYNSENKYIVRYGKIGNAGISKEFKFPKNEKGIAYRKKEVNKLIETKINKGYQQEVSPGSLRKFAPSTKKRMQKMKNNYEAKYKSQKKSENKTCPPGKMINPKTGRCVIDRSEKPTKNSKKVNRPKMSIVFKRNSKKNLYCVPRFEEKYRSRPSPPYPAADCPVGTIATGNDGLSYQVIRFNSKSGLSNRWVKCGNVKTNCKPTKKKLIPSKVKPVKSLKNKKQEKTCPPGKVLSPKGRCVIDRSKPSSAKSSKSQSKEVKYQVKGKGKVLYDVNKQGVMLAHTFKDPKTGKIKTAPSGSPQAPNGWYLSEKYDGYRAIWDGVNFRSRNGNIFEAPDFFKQWLPSNHALDGELFMGRENFEKCGIFRRKDADCDEWKKAKVTYQIFDSPTMKGVFEERTKQIKSLIAQLCKSNSGKCPLKMTTQIKVKNEADVYKHFDKLVKKGAEGVMLRAPNSPYDAKRSSYLLKVKQLFDAECKIIGYKAGTGKYKNMLGAFECQLVKNKNIKFTISGMDDTIRQNYKKSHPIGTIVTFTYMGLSERGVPRHPNYLRKRGKE